MRSELLNLSYIICYYEIESNVITYKVYNRQLLNWFNRVSRFNYDSKVKYVIKGVKREV